ncbi:MAG: hypothetical protein GXY61_09860 [Lentisphaerae bacterium]|nr:hypothetical protein [Lentisphaerota bacterium]
MEHYDIDGLVQYGNQELPGTTEVVNPTWRTLDKAVRGNLYKLRKLHAALVGLLRPHLGKEADARALIRELFVSAKASVCWYGSIGWSLQHTTKPSQRCSANSRS